MTGGMWSWSPSTASWSASYERRASSERDRGPTIPWPQGPRASGALPAKNGGNARSYRAVMENGISCGKIRRQEKTRSSDRVFSRQKEAAVMPDMRPSVCWALRSRERGPGPSRLLIQLQDRAVLPDKGQPVALFVGLHGAADHAVGVRDVLLQVIHVGVDRLDILGRI